MPNAEEIIPYQVIVDARIYTVRGQSVMLDSDLAEVYGVTTGQLNQAVRRNERRFPEAFSFQLKQNEMDILISQFVISRSAWGGHRKLPRVFTEHGAVMLASVLKSDRAVQASIAVVQAFVRLRHILDANRDLAAKVGELSQKVDEHDESIGIIFEELEDLVSGDIPLRPKERIGYKTK